MKEHTTTYRLPKGIESLSLVNSLDPAANFQENVERTEKYAELLHESAVPRLWEKALVLQQKLKTQDGMPRSNLYISLLATQKCD